MTPLRRIGGVDRLDADGCIVNPARLDLIRPPWLSAVQALVQRCRDLFGADVHGIYLRGSVARGLAIPGFSDLDAILVVREFTSRPLDSSIRTIEAAVQAEFTFLRGVELAAVERRELRGQPDSHVDRTCARSVFTLKTQGVCVDGIDLIATLHPVRPGIGTMIEARRLKPSIEYVLARIERPAARPEELAAYCAWLMKIAVRAAFELIQSEEQCYTRDLYCCAELFARRYPARDEDIWQAVVWAVDPVATRVELKSYLDRFGVWLCREYENLIRRGHVTIQLDWLQSRR